MCAGEPRRPTFRRAIPIACAWRGHGLRFHHRHHFGAAGLRMFMVRLWQVRVPASSGGTQVRSHAGASVLPFGAAGLQ